MVPLLQVQLVHALAFHESPASSTSPSLVMQYSCWLLFTGRKGLSVSSAVAHSNNTELSEKTRKTSGSDVRLVQVELWRAIAFEDRR